MEQKKKKEIQGGELSVVEDNYTRIDILEAILYKEYSDKKILKEGILTNTRW